MRKEACKNMSFFIKIIEKGSIIIMMIEDMDDMASLKSLKTQPPLYIYNFDAS